MSLGNLIFSLPATRDVRIYFPQIRLSKTSTGAIIVQLIWLHSCIIDGMCCCHSWQGIKRRPPNGKKFGHSIFRHFHEFSSAFPATDVFHFFDDSPSAFHLATSLFPQCHRRQLATTTFDNYFSFRNQTIRIFDILSWFRSKRLFIPRPAKTLSNARDFSLRMGGKKIFLLSDAAGVWV